MIKTIYNIRYFQDESLYFVSYDTVKHKIKKIGTKGDILPTKNIIDGKGASIWPGLIDAHCHIGFITDGISLTGEDVNEESNPVTPHLRAIDGLNMNEGYFADALASGVKTVVTGVGSANAIGGDMIAVRTDGKTADDACIASVGIKFALGENPKSCYAEREETPVTRMATAACIREALFVAREYMLKKESEDESPDFDMKSEALIPLLRGEKYAHFHAHRADDIMTALRICREFGLKCVLIHGTEGYLVADELKKAQDEGILRGVVVGPVISDRGKQELANYTPKNAGILAEKGVRVAICTDHPETPINYLALSAALCVKNGMSHDDAIRAITSAAAEIVGIPNKGKIAPDYDSDFFFTNGDILDIFSEMISL